MINASDTIYALSSGALPSGVAVIRLSGPSAALILERILGRLPAPRTLTYGTLRIEGEVLDHAMAVWFPGPNSATGEDCAELHLHGSVAVVNAARQWLSLQPALRHAESGEFTLRGFHNGRFDLTAVEALSDLITAETEAQRRQALGGIEGTIRDVCLNWRQAIQTLRAEIEAELDFSDQDDVPTGDQTRAALHEKIDSLVLDIRMFRARLSAAEVVRRGYRVAIVGAPNAGKSSLINALAMRDVAIVTDEPGTTRDLVEVTLDLGGQKVVVTDTAGIRDAVNEAERLGVTRALGAATAADLVLSVSAPLVPDIDVDTKAEVVRVGAKADVDRVANVDIWVSAQTGAGMASLVELIENRAARRVEGAAGIPLRERHANCLELATRELLTARESEQSEIAAEHLRVAAMEIGRIVGLGDTEELLGEIFSRFCIGK